MFSIPSIYQYAWLYSCSQLSLAIELSYNTTTVETGVPGEKPLQKEIGNLISFLFSFCFSVSVLLCLHLVSSLDFSTHLLQCPDRLFSFTPEEQLTYFLPGISPKLYISCRECTCPENKNQSEEKEWIGPFRCQYTVMQGQSYY